MHTVPVSTGARQAFPKERSDGGHTPCNLALTHGHIQRSRTGVHAPVRHAAWTFEDIQSANKQKHVQNGACT
jgi:hypothetical protein